jgi:hypothetical protein
MPRRLTTILDSDAPRDRHSAQLPLLRTRLHPSRLRRPQLAFWLRRVRRLLRPGNRTVGHAGAPEREQTPALLGLRPSLQCRGHDRPRPRLPRHPNRPPGTSRTALGAAYAIPILYVPLLMITHFVAFYLLLHRQPKAARVFAGVAAATKNERCKLKADDLRD